MNQESLFPIEANIRAVGRQERLVVERPYFHIFISPQTLDHLTCATPRKNEIDRQGSRVLQFVIHLSV